MSKVYIVQDNDMENVIVTVSAFNTMEKARNAAKEILDEVQDQYDRVEYSDCEWSLLEVGGINRVISILEEEVY